VTLAEGLEHPLDQGVFAYAGETDADREPAAVGRAEGDLAGGSAAQYGGGGVAEALGVGVGEGVGDGVAVGSGVGVTGTTFS
jgi:hypothetical protein